MVFIVLMLSFGYVIVNNTIKKEEINTCTHLNKRVFVYDHSLPISGEYRCVDCKKWIKIEELNKNVD